MMKMKTNVLSLEDVVRLKWIAVGDVLTELGR